MIYSHYEDIAKLAENTVSSKEKDLIAPFLKTYYSLASNDDLASYSPESLFAIAHQHFKLLQSHNGKTSNINAYNPNQEEYGYTADFSVIDIVTQDRPFLIDSIQMAFVQEGIAIQFITHPIFSLQFDDSGISHLENAKESSNNNTSVIHIECNRLSDEKLTAIVEKIAKTLNKINLATSDWRNMSEKVQHIACEIKGMTNLPQTAEEISETIKFLEWIQTHHFTFLGYRNCDLRDDNLYVIEESGLGILRNDGAETISKSFAALPETIKQQVLKPDLLTLSKSHKISAIHRPVYMDFVGIKRFNSEGKVIGEHQILGLLTAEAYRTLPRNIPLVAHKINAIYDSVKLPENSHAAKIFENVLSQLPRDELFQATAEQIKTMALSVFHMQERDVLRFFARKDIFESFVSCYVYVPRDRFSTQLRMKFEKYLCEKMGGHSTTFATHFTDNLHVRVNILVRTTPGQIKEFDGSAIENDLNVMMLDWNDEVFRIAKDVLGKSAGSNLCKEFQNAIPSAYREEFKPAAAIKDLQVLSTLEAGNDTLALNIYQTKTQAAKDGSELSLKLYGKGEPATLSDILPILENFGFTVKLATPYPFKDDSLWLTNFVLNLPKPLNELSDKSLDELAPLFVEAFTNTWNGSEESDKFDQLVFNAGIASRDINMLRAISKYMIQAKAPFSNQYMQQAINNNADIATLLVELFHARMGLSVDNREAVVVQLQQALEAKLSKVASLDEDRILRWFMIVINAMVRTNFFQKDKDGNLKDYFSFKVESGKIPDLPLPKPLYETFVYSTDLEAIHLRGGKVARGGLRWSDRIEDFRTEVLGLVKAQIVKNAIIVPVGSKGGFIVKKPDNSSREAFLNEGIRCYKIFMRGLLDITDNIVGGNIVPPKDVYRHDNDDPYLVVAADKGTATFSDIANGMAAEYGFWLGDAFASGGSVGYDHKGMGITAKGAWESVKRHFRHLGKDIQKEEFTVIGIGDMGGDVFGNGMLLSEKIQLVAAFNHMHIFIDPTPNAATTYIERKRLFETPRTTWDDFDKSLISKGGGVFSRSEKSIAITPEMKKTFDIEEDSLSPTQLINRLLKAPVELLWNGGIGTYVKGENETHEQVGDKANDALRINGGELRCKVIGEGGNLGFTQLGRIDYAKKGGLVFTDAIDNSGGVNCSDHEVNIKILLNQAVETGDITVEERNVILEKMTDEVGQLVLRQNYQQPQAINLDLQNKSLFIDHVRIIRQLEKEGRLNRALEFLPSEEEIKERMETDKGLYAPELAVLLAYSKIQLFEELIESSLPDQTFFFDDLKHYFPSALRDTYFGMMKTHRLHREIIATFVTNSILNHMGSVFIHRTKEETGQSSEQVVLAYCASRNILGARKYWNAIDLLDNKVDADLQNELHLRVRKTLDKFSHWFLTQRRDCIDIEALQAEFKALSTIAQALPKVLAPANIEATDKEAQTLIEQGIPADLAKELAYLPYFDNALDIISLANRKGITVEDATQLYFSIANTLEARWLTNSIESLYSNDYWQRRACHSLTASLNNTIIAVAEQASTMDSNPTTALNNWKETFASRLESYKNCLAEIQQGTITLSHLSVAIGEMSSLAGNSQ